MVKDTLDRQLQEQEQQRMKTLQYNKRMDNQMLSIAQRELQQEKKEKTELKKKIQLQKVQRDVMLLEAKERKIKEIQTIRNKELLEVEQLKKDIEKEHRMKAEKKRKQKEDALKIIELNEQEKVKRMAEKEKDRIYQVKLIEEYN